jgi:hypothetical protein
MAQVDTTVWSPSKRGWTAWDLLALAAFTAAVAWLFRGVLFFDRVLFYFDVSEINYPYRAFLAEEWRAGRFSRWHPGLYCGMALFSESQAGYFHPLKPLYLILPVWRAFTWDTVLSVWLTGVATYGWLRRHVGSAGALTGSAVFGLGGFMWAHLVHTSMINALIGVPVAVWALESTWDGGRWRGAVVGALALASQVCAGHLQDSLLTGVLLGLYALYRAAQERGWKSRAFALGSLAVLVGLGVAIAAIQWIPSKELIDRSPRSEGIPWAELTYGSWHPELIPTWLMREAYGTRARDTDWMDGYYPYHEMNIYLGVVALLLAVVGGAAYRDRWVGFWVLLAGLGLAMMLGRFTILFDHMTSVPFLGRGRIPVRYHLWFSLAIAALAAVGVDRLVRGGPVRLRAATATLSGLAFVSVPILLWVYQPIWTETGRWKAPYNQAQFRWLAEDLVHGAIRMAILWLLALLVARLAIRSARRGPRRAWAATLPVLVLVELGLAHQHEVPSVPSTYWTEPPESARVIAAEPDAVRVVGFQERSLAEPGYASGGWDYFEPRFFQARETLSYSLAPVWGLKSGEGVTPIIPTRFLAYANNVPIGQGRFDVESVSHLVSTQETLAGFGPPRRAGTVFVHRNPRVLPRARLMGRPVYVEDRPSASRALRALGTSVRERLVVEDPDRPLAEGAEVSGTARIVTDLPEHVEVEVEARTAAYLFLADTFDPGWSATLGGRPVPIRPAQANFRAVFVPPGSHRVVFTYEPTGFRLGLGLTCGGLAISGVLLIWPRRIAVLEPEHGEGLWPAWWPWGLLVVLLGIVAVSAVRFGGAGGIAPHPRWDGSWHRFTWSAGIEAMKPPPPPVE